MKLVIIFGIILSLFFQIFCKDKCYRNGRIVCCSGFTWNNVTKQCERCPLGYGGVECIYQCGFPSYGQDCEMRCDCPEDQCDFKFGCKMISTAGIERTFPKIYHNTEKSLPSTTKYKSKTYSAKSQFADMTKTSSTPTSKEEIENMQFHITDRVQTISMTSPISKIDCWWNADGNKDLFSSAISCYN